MRIEEKSTCVGTNTRGAAGGYELIKPPEDVSLGDVMHVIEGAQEFQPTSSAAPDSLAAQVLLSAWQEVTDVEQDTLRGITFAELCEAPLGTLDYLALAHQFHTVFIDAIPVLSPERRDVARRFVNLIDTLYDNRIGLVASAAAEPGGLYPRGDAHFLFERTASRLIEMRSEGYLAARAERSAPGGGRT